MELFEEGPLLISFLMGKELNDDDDDDMGISGDEGILKEALMARYKVLRVSTFPEAKMDMT